MSVAVGAPCEDGSLAAILYRANASLDAGNADEARSTAQGALRLAEECGDRLHEARSLAFLGHCDRLASRFRRAHDSSQRAAHLFKILGDVSGEMLALSTQSYAASCLGRNEDAVEAALLCVSLGDQMPGGPQQVCAYNNLGVAYFWSRGFDKSDAALEFAVSLARAPGSIVTAFQPTLNMACAESLRLVNERYLSGQLPSTDRLCTLVAHALSELSPSHQLGLQHGMLAVLKSMQFIYSGLAKCWSNDLAGAMSDLDEARTWADKFQTRTWLHALENWVRAEVAWVQNDLELAEQLMTEVVGEATHVEHEQLVCMGHLILAQLHDLRGRPEQALSELQVLRRREQQIRAESLESRGRSIRWQIELRQSEQSLQVLKTTSRRFERMSLEDSLTGIANRRHLEERLGDLLSINIASRQDLSVAVIDVDRFKDVNDIYSHQVGDEVLKRIAALIVATVRECDIPARLAGDEFVVVFPNTSAVIAGQISERIRSAVAMFDWDSLAGGLRVSISSGVGAAQADDTVESLLDRGDKQMYVNKRE